MTDATAQVRVLRNRLADLCTEHLSIEAAGLMQRLARPAVRLNHAEGSTRSHLGGAAMLNDDVEWPRWNDQPLALVAVVDRADLAGFTTDVGLPETGTLNFFYEANEQQAWGFEPSHREGWRVVRADTNAAARSAPAGASVFPSISLVPHQTLTVPGWEEPAVASIVPPHRPRATSRLEEFRTRATHTQEQRKRREYFDFLDAWSEVIDLEANPNHQIGGWPRLQQNPIWKECDIVSQGLPLGTSAQWNDPRIAALPDTQGDWHLLLQLDTDDDAGWMWGDLGTLYYAVRDSLRPTEALDRAWMVFQCG